ncbi:MAG: MnmC family methyltransferase [Nanoarchaeota archaeon]|nr:MnmC family methyltransferase [Nanoarchaeota archaeon]
MLRKITLADGTQTFLNEELQVCYHSQAGVITEAMEKYVVPCKIPELAKCSELRLLDIGFGLGYHAAMAIHQALEHNPQCAITVVGLEKDRKILQHIAGMPFPIPFYTQFKRLVPPTFTFQEKKVHVQVLLGDARKRVKELSAEHFDAVFFDPFPPEKTPELWEVPFLQEVRRVMKKEAVLATYSCAPAVRERLAGAGFFWDETKGERGRRGTMAGKWG